MSGGVDCGLGARKDGLRCSAMEWRGVVSGRNVSWVVGDGPDVRLLAVWDGWVAAE